MKRIIVLMIIISLVSLVTVNLSRAQGIRISVSTDKKTYAPGETVTITVVVTKDGQSYANCPIGFKIKDPRGGEFTLPPQYTDANGKAVRKYKLHENVPRGTWTVTAYISGTEYHASCTFTVSAGPPPEAKKSSSITLDLSTDVITYGEYVTINGSIIVDEIITAVVTIEYSLNNVTWTLIGTVKTVDNFYNYSWYPPKAGVYFLRARWPGSDRYYGATSKIVKLTVLKANVNITLTISKRVLRAGEELVLEGKLKPALPDISILIEYRVNEGPWIVVTTIKTDSKGYFTITWAPPTGNVTIRVSWPGNENYNGFSKTIKIVVGKAKVSLSLAGGLVLEHSPMLSSCGKFSRELGVIELTMSGPSGYSEIITLKVPKSILDEYNTRASEVVVLVNGEVIKFTYRLENDTYVFAFGIRFSERKIRVILAMRTLTITIFDQHNRPISDVLIECLYENRTLIGRGTTDESGTLNLRLPTGNYTVRILWRGKVKEQVIELAKTNVKISESFTTYDLTIKVISSILKNPIPAVVILKGKEVTLKNVTDPKGVCKFTQLLPGTYEVKVISLGTIITKTISIKKDTTTVFTVSYIGETILLIGIVALMLSIIIALAVIIRQRRK